MALAAWLVRQKVYPADHFGREFDGHWIHALAATKEKTLLDYR